ncbi:hypothetical protein PAXRUDRAFT_176723, partial [Paxillus rubicundulus Ve08.2h10]
VHIRVEHAFAALKGCFQSLRELRLQMKTEDDLFIAMYWVECCLILHNMIIQFEEQREGQLRGTMDWAIAEGQEVDDGQGDQIYNQVGGTEGQRFHGHLMERLFEECSLWF